jgi:hypothetical protein
MDDAFDDHEKVLALLDIDEGIAAIGLWTLCWTWAHRNTRKKGRTPGLLPSTLPRRFVGARGKELAGLLVDVGMWDAAGDGWMIHDFADYLPDKELSTARSEAGKKGAASRWGNRKPDGKLPSSDGKADSKTDGHDVTTGVSGEPGEAIGPGDEPDNPPDGKQSFRDSNLPSVSHSSDDKSVASDGSRAGARWVRAGVGVSGSLRTSVTLPQTEPDPSDPVASGDEAGDEGALISLSSVPKKPEPGSDEDPCWLRFWAAFPLKKSKQEARDKWAKAIRAGEDPELIIAGAERYAAEMRRENKPKSAIKHPNGWLSGRRWDDESDDNDENPWRWENVEERAPAEYNR